MIENVDIDDIRHVLGRLPAPDSSSIKQRPSDTSDASLQAGFAAFVNKAIQSQETDEQEKVQRAQRLLASGELERPKNIHLAAQDIITFGI